MVRLWWEIMVHIRSWFLIAVHGLVSLEPLCSLFDVRNRRENWSSLRKKITRDKQTLRHTEKSYVNYIPEHVHMKRYPYLTDLQLVDNVCAHCLSVFPKINNWGLLFVLTICILQLFRHCAKLAMSDIAIWLNGQGQVAVCKLMINYFIPFITIIQLQYLLQIYKVLIANNWCLFTVK